MLIPANLYGVIF